MKKQKFKIFDEFLRCGLLIKFMVKCFLENKGIFDETGDFNLLGNS